MGFFDEISSVFNSGTNAQPHQIAGPIMGALQQSGIGGISDIVTQFEQSGLGAHVASWVGGGPNTPISSDDIQQVFGLPFIANFAAKMGVDPQQAASLLAQHLPGVVNHLTPAGQVPDDA